MNSKEVEVQHMKMQESINEYTVKEGYPTEDYKFVAIGYLAWGELFEKGEVSQNFLNKLRILYEEGGMSGHLGHHECEFCIDEGNYEGRATSNTEKTLTDTDNNIKYQFPEMIFHYIEVHNFKPSDEFIEFVMRS